MPTRSRTHHARHHSVSSTAASERLGAKTKGKTTTSGLARTASSRAASSSAGNASSRETTHAGEGTERSSGQLRDRPVAEPVAKQARKPAFTTLQQHYTPKKRAGSSKRGVVASVSGTAAGDSNVCSASASTSTSVAVTPATSDLRSQQATLLQLHLLHSSATPTFVQWRRSAERSLRRKFEDVVAEYEVARESERAVREVGNLVALREWGGGGGGGGVEGVLEKVVVLGNVVQELGGLVGWGDEEEEGEGRGEGRYQRLVGGFEGWIREVKDVRDRRRRGAGDDGDEGEEDVECIEDLGDAWKSEHAAMTRKVAGLRRDLVGIGMPREGASDVAGLVRLCGMLTDGVLEELRVMREVEGCVVEAEREWVDEKLRGLGDIKVREGEGEEEEDVGGGWGC